MRIKATYLSQPVQLVTLDNRVVWVRQDDEVDVRDSPHTRALLARGEVAEVVEVADALEEALCTASVGVVEPDEVAEVCCTLDEPAPDLDLTIAWSEAAELPDPVEPPEYAATEAELAALNAAAHTAPPTEPEYLTMVEAAERLGKSTSTLRRWAARGYGPQPVTVDGAVRYQAGSILAFQAKLRYHGGDE